MNNWIVFDLFCSFEYVCRPCTCVCWPHQAHSAFFWEHEGRRQATDCYIRSVYKGVRKLPRKVKMISVGCLLAFCLLDNRYSLTQNYLNHTFEYLAQFIEMKTLFSLQFYKPKHNHSFTVQIKINLLHWICSCYM